jgi:DNA-binding response OmpR family regulator
MYRLVIIEKSNLIQNFLKNSFLSNNFSIHSFAEPEEFLGNFDIIKPDCVFLDENIAEMNSITFCETLRNKYSLLLPIILLVNFHSYIDLQKLKNLGVDFLIKPFDSQALIEKIKFLLKIEDKKMTVADVTVPEEKKVIEKEVVKEDTPEEIFEKIKPYLKNEIRNELRDLIRQFEEALEKKYA